MRRAIALEDTARFEAIPGIGKKTAQRVVLELKEKLGTMDEPAAIAGKPHAVARDALVELGWSLAEAEDGPRRRPIPTLPAGGAGAAGA